MPGDIRNKLFKTKCGLFVKNELWVIQIIPYVYYGGSRHICITCKLRQCQNCNHVLLKGYKGPMMCAVEEIEKYDDENSINKIIREMNEKYYKEKRELEKGSWYKCPNIVQNYDRAIKRYDITECTKINCMNEVCIVTGQKRDTELVNIFYDLDLSEKQGFLVFEKWERNLKYFDTRVARDIAEKHIPIIRENEPEKLNLRIQTMKTKSLDEDLEKLRFNTKLTGGN